MTERIQAVIFDLGRVLVDIDNTLLVEKLFKGLEADDLQDLARKTMADPAMVEFNSGRTSPEAFYRRMCETYDIQSDFETFCRLWCEIFFPMDGMEELVRNVSKHVAVGLLSDTDPIHWNFIRRRWPWIGAIPNPTLSYEVGLMKPDAKIFRAAAAHVQKQPGQCLFIDDLQVNVDGARAAGMQAVRFVGIERLRDDMQRRGLLETNH